MAKKQKPKPHFTALLSQAEVKKVIRTLSTTRTNRDELGELYSALPDPYKIKFSSRFLRHPQTSNGLRGKIFDYWLQQSSYVSSDDEALYKVKQDILSSGQLSRAMIQEAIGVLFRIVKDLFVAAEEPLDPDNSPLSEIGVELSYRDNDAFKAPELIAKKGQLDNEVIYSALPWGPWSKILRTLITNGKFGKDDDMLFRFQAKQKMYLLVSVIKNPATTGHQLERIYVEGLGKYLNEIGLATLLAELDWKFLANPKHPSFGIHFRKLVNLLRQVKKWQGEAVLLPGPGVTWVEKFPGEQQWLRWGTLWGNSGGVKEYLAVFESEILPALARNGKLPSSIRTKLLQYGSDRMLWYRSTLPSFPPDMEWEGVKFQKQWTDNNREAVRLALALNPSLPKRDLLVLAKDDCVSVALIARSQLRKRFK